MNPQQKKRLPKNFGKMADGSVFGEAAPKKKTVKAWADIGSHGGIYTFEMGPVAQRYPKLMHIYREKVDSNLVPCTITYSLPPKSKKRRAKTV